MATESMNAGQTASGLAAHRSWADSEYPRAPNQYCVRAKLRELGWESSRSVRSERLSNHVADCVRCSFVILAGGVRIDTKGDVRSGVAKSRRHALHIDSGCE